MLRAAADYRWFYAVLPSPAGNVRPPLYAAASRAAAKDICECRDARARADAALRRYPPYRHAATSVRFTPTRSPNAHLRRRYARRLTACQ